MQRVQSRRRWGGWGGNGDCYVFLSWIVLGRRKKKRSSMGRIPSGAAFSALDAQQNY
jgi:hypothetical protein